MKWATVRGLLPAQEPDESKRGDIAKVASMFGRIPGESTPVDTPTHQHKVAEMMSKAPEAPAPKRPVPKNSEGAAPAESTLVGAAAQQSSTILLPAG